MSVQHTAATSHEDLRPVLVRYLTGLGLDAEDSRDVVQDVFLKLHIHLRAGGGGNLRAWLFRVAHNEARNRQKRYERRFSGSMDGVDVESAGNPESDLLEREKSNRLRSALDTLPDLERECLRLRADGKRYREIGEALALPVSTVADIVERAIRKLAEVVR